MAMKQIRLGIVGSGIAAHELHLPALRKLRKEFKVVAVCSRRVAKARSFAATVGSWVEVESSLEAMLARTDIDAIDVATPIMLNNPTAMAALRAGKHVFIEKPVCVDLQEGRLLASLARRSGLVAMTGENMRYRAVVDRARKLLRERTIGQLRSFTWILQSHLKTSNKYAQTHWRQRHAYEGGFVFDGGVHNIAVIRRLAGNVAEVNARTVSVNRRIGEIDGVYMELQMKNGVRGAVNMQFSAPLDTVDQLTLVGTKGIMVMLGDTLLISAGRGPVSREVFKDDGGFQAEFEDFHRAVTAGGELRSTVAEGMADVAVFLAVFRSAKKGRSASV
jgi:predicted dehydrogenase